MKYKNLIVGGLAIALGSFFIYKGVNKHFLSPCKIYPEDSPLPIDYIHIIDAFCRSGFSKVVGAIQILSGVLLIIPRTRLLGAIILLPVILNIFLIHLYLDNRPHELVETGIPLAVNLLVLLNFLPKIKRMFAD